MKYTNGIYQQAQRSQPIIYLDKSNATQAFDWVTSISKTNDMITNSFLVNGYEHPIVVVFNNDDCFEHNLAMRSTGLLVIVNLDSDTLCFSDENDCNCRL